jgi:hypothetical protein
MEVQMAFFEAKAAAVASALTLLILVTSFNSALSQENSVTAPALPATQDGIWGFLLVAHFDIAYVDGDQSIEGAAPQPVRTASQSKNKLARGGHCTSIARRKARTNTRQRNLHNANKAFRSRAVESNSA